MCPTISAIDHLPGAGRFRNFDPGTPLSKPLELLWRRCLQFQRVLLSGVAEHPLPILLCRFLHHVLSFGDLASRMANYRGCVGVGMPRGLAQCLLIEANLALAISAGRLPDVSIWKLGLLNARGCADQRLRMCPMALKSVEARARVFAISDRKVRLKPEEQELARKREEQAALELELAARELQLANLLAELAEFERRYLRLRCRPLR